MILAVVIALAMFAIAIASILLRRLLQRRGLSRCAIPYLSQVNRRRRVAPGEPVHLLLCIADHFEPQWGQPPRMSPSSAIRNWVDRYPTLFDAFRDSDGRSPRHTFFLPIDQYDPATWTHWRAFVGEDMAKSRSTCITITTPPTTCAETCCISRNSLPSVTGFSRRRSSNQITYGFIHGNWAPDNARGPTAGGAA